MTQLAKTKRPPCRVVFVLELLGGFEPPTSSLPSDKKPSSRWYIRLCGHFCRKKDEVGNSLLHVFRPFVSPCGSRCGSELFQLIKKQRQHIVDDRTTGHCTSCDLHPLRHHHVIKSGFSVEFPQLVLMINILDTAAITSRFTAQKRGRSKRRIP